MSLDGHRSHPAAFPTPSPPSVCKSLSCVRVSFIFSGSPPVRTSDELNWHFMLYSPSVRWTSPTEIETRWHERRTLKPLRHHTLALGTVVPSVLSIASINTAYNANRFRSLFTTCNHWLVVLQMNPLIRLVGDGIPKLFNWARVVAVASCNKASCTFFP